MAGALGRALGRERQEKVIKRNVRKQPEHQGGQVR